MSLPRVVSVNVGTPVAAPWAGSLGRTAIDKRPVDGPVRCATLGLEGDQVADHRHHGGIHQAVYAFAQRGPRRVERAARRARSAPGMFGENLTTAGIDVNEAVLGEHWRIGTALLEHRARCASRATRSRAGWAGRASTTTAWVKRFAAEGRPGPYLRVLEEGTLQAGDEIVVEHRPEHGVTVSMMFRALMSDRSCCRCCSAYAGLPEAVYDAAAASRAGAVRPDPGPKPAGNLPAGSRVIYVVQQRVRHP